MAMVSFYRIATIANLPTASAETEGRMYFVEDTQSFYKGSVKKVNNVDTYEFTPVKVLINGANATLSDADVLKVRNDDNTLSAASQAKLDKPMDTEALYKTFLTRKEEMKVYIVPNADVITQTCWDGPRIVTAGPYADTSYTVEVPDIEATLNALDNTYKDGKKIVLIQKSPYNYMISNYDNEEYITIPSNSEDDETLPVAWPDWALNRYQGAYGSTYSVPSSVSNVTRNSNIYDEFYYSTITSAWEKIGDWSEDFASRWNISVRMPAMLDSH